MFQFLHGTRWAYSVVERVRLVVLVCLAMITQLLTVTTGGGQGWPGDGVTVGVIRPTWLAVSAAVGLVETGPMPEAGRGACWIMEREGEVGY